MAMSPEELRKLLALARYEKSEDASKLLQQHQDEHPENAQTIAEYEALDRLLDLDETQPPRPGFDTRFFAQLQTIKESSRTAQTNLWEQLRWAFAPLLMLGTAAMALLLLPHPQQTAPMTSDVELSMNLELLEDYEVLTHFEEIEDFDLLASLTINEIEALANKNKVRYQ